MLLISPLHNTLSNISKKGQGNKMKLQLQKYFLSKTILSWEKIEERSLLKDGAWVWLISSSFWFACLGYNKDLLHQRYFRPIAALCPIFPIFCPVFNIFLPFLLQVIPMPWLSRICIGKSTLLGFNFGTAIL